MPSNDSALMGRPLTASRTSCPGKCAIATCTVGTGGANPSLGCRIATPGSIASTSIFASSAAVMPGGRAEASAGRAAASSPPSAPIVGTTAESALPATTCHSRRGDGADALDLDLDAPIAGESVGVVALGDRLVGAAPVDLDARLRQRGAQIIGDGLRARGRQRVVVGEAPAVTRRYGCPVGVTDDADRELAHAAPRVGDGVELGAVARVDGRLHRAELRRERIRVVARRERVADALDDRFAALHDVRYGVRALGAAERRREAQQRLHRVLAGGISGAARRERHLRSAVERAEREAQRAALRQRIPRRDAVACCAARNVRERFGQQHEDFRFAQRHAARGDRGHMLEAVAAELRRQREAHVTCRSGALRHEEIGRAERAAAHVDELRQRVAGAAYARVAAHRRELLGQRDRIELHDVRARRHAFEVVLALVVGHGIAAVLEVDAHAFDAFA